MPPQSLHCTTGFHSARSSLHYRPCCFISLFRRHTPQHTSQALRLRTSTANLAVFKRYSFFYPFGMFTPKDSRPQSPSEMVVGSNKSKHNSKGTGLVAKADKGSLRQSQKISTLLRSGSIFWSALASLSPNLWHTCIMFHLIFRCKLAGWWLVIYVHRSSGFRCFFLRHTGWYYLRLVWLSFSVSKLPF